MHKIIFASFTVASLSVAGCATTGFSLDRQAPGSHARLEFAQTAILDDGARLVHPIALDPALPSADRIARQLDVELGDTASAAIQLCVAPAGRVTRVAIERSSSSKAFDDAVLHDIASWRFAPTPGPASVQSCQSATIVYQSRS